MAAAGLTLGVALALPVAEAATVDVLNRADIPVSGIQTNSYSFSVSSPGALSVSLDDVIWPEPLQFLDVSILAPQGALTGKLNAGDGQQVNITQAGLYYALVDSTPGTSTGLDLGMFSLRLQFTPAGTVPLPGAMSLLLMGLGILGVNRLLWRVSPEPMPA